MNNFVKKKGMFQLRIYPIFGLAIGLNYYEQTNFDGESEIVVQFFLLLLQIDIVKNLDYTDGVQNWRTEKEITGSD